MEIRRFVRNEIIRIKVALRLRPFIDVLSELQRSDLNVGGCARLFVVPGNCARSNNECCQESGQKNGISAQLRNGHHGSLSPAVDYIESTRPSRGVDVI